MGFTCNFFEGVNGAPSNLVVLPNAVVSGFVVLTTNLGQSTNPAFWTNILQFTTTTGQLFSDPFLFGTTPPFTLATVLGNAGFIATNPVNPTVYTPSPNTYNIFSSGLGQTLAPEPSTLALMGTAMFGILIIKRRRKRS